MDPMSVSSNHVDLDESNDPAVKTPRRKSLKRQLSRQASVQHIAKHKKKYGAGCIAITAIVVGVIIGVSVGVGVAVHNASTASKEATVEQNQQNAQAENALVNIGGQSAVPAVDTSATSGRRLTVASFARALRAGLDRRLNIDVGSFKPDSDYHVSTTSVEVRDPSNDALVTPNGILCLLGYTRADKFFNQGPFTAMINMQRCFPDNDPALTRWIVEATSPPAAATTGNYRLKVWLHWRVPTGGSIIYKFDATAPKDQVTFYDDGRDPELGRFSMRVQPEGNPFMDFALMLDLWYDDSTQEEKLEYHMRQTQTMPGEPARTMEEAAVTSFNRRTKVGAARTLGTDHRYNSTSRSGYTVPVTFSMGISGDYMSRQRNSDTPVCVDRSSSGLVESTSGWGGYELYDSTGSIVSVDTHIQIKQTVNGAQIEGSLSPWGVYSYSNTPNVDTSTAFADGSTVQEQTWGSSPSDNEPTYTIRRKQGTLTKVERYTLTPEQYAFQNMSMWTYDSNLGQNTRVTLQFREGQLFNVSGPSAVPFTLPSGRSSHVSTNAFGYSWGELVATGSSYELRLSRRTRVNPSTPGVATSLVCINTPEQWDYNYVNSWSMNNCLNAASLGTAQHSQRWGRQRSHYTAAYGLEPLRVASRSNFTHYTFDAATNTVMQGSDPVVFPDSNTNWMVGENPCGSSSGSSSTRASSAGGNSLTQCSTLMRLMEDSDANYAALGCSGSTGICSSTDFQQLDIFYELEIGQGPETAWLTDTVSGDVKAPQEELRLSITVAADTPNSLSGTNFNGATFLTTYESNSIRGTPNYCYSEATGELKPAVIPEGWGHYTCNPPTSSGGISSSGAEWDMIADFIIPAGSLAQSVFSDETQYVLRPKRIEQFFTLADSDSRCSNIQRGAGLTLPTGSRWSDVNIGSEPGTAPVRVVDGVIQTSENTN